jgi:DDE superfamily endonuclease
MCIIPVFAENNIMETDTAQNPTPKKLARLLDDLLENEWGFLDEPWPMCPKIKTFHRSELKPIARIQDMKKVLMKRLGAIPVFFFLSTIWSKHYFPGPYNALEKGIAFLYFFVAGETMDSMAQYMPKSTFHLIYSTFVKVERALFEKEITRCFASMFSSLEIRIRTANWKNPPLFKHVTLYLDGHDSRATYGEDKAAMYSYKLKKSGLRTQVAIDSNGMVLFVSKSASCRDNNDGKMLQEMGIGKKIDSMDCIALDGGYTQYIGDIVEKEKLDEHNFCFPIRKKRLQQLYEEESNFNAIFGGFRSTSEATFGDLMKTFAKFNNKEIVRVGSKKEFNLTFRLCLLLLNVRNFVKAVDIEELPHHRGWMEEGVDYPRERQLVPELTQTVTVQNKLENGLELQRLQEDFLGLDVASDDDEQMSNKDDDEHMSNNDDDDNASV